MVIFRSATTMDVAFHYATAMDRTGFRIAAFGPGDTGGWFVVAQREGPEADFVMLCNRIDRRAGNLINGQPIDHGL